MKSARWTVISVGAGRQRTPKGPGIGFARQGGHGSRLRGRTRRGSAERNPVERSGVHTGVCRVPDPRPSPYTLHRGPVDGGPVHRKIRPPGASRRRATDNHVTLLLYRYRSRRHNTAPRPRTTAPLCAARGRGGKKGARKNEEEIILYFSYEPVRYLPSSVHSAEEHWVSSRGNRGAMMEEEGEDWSREVLFSSIDGGREICVWVRRIWG